MEYDIILATQSEIRRNLLKNTGIRFKAIKSDFDEAQLQDALNGKICSLKDAQDLVMKLSFEKAKNISCRYSKDLIIGCDQTLYFKKRILNNVKIKVTAKLYDIISDYNSLWILTSNELMKVDYNGLLDYRIPNSANFNKIRFFKKNIFLASDDSVGYLNKKELKINLFKIPKLFIKDFFVINESLYIYEEDFYNRFLIKKK